MANDLKSNYKIGDNLKKLRVKKGYSLEKVARLAGLSLNTVIRIESGVNKNPTIETLTKLASAFDVTLDGLIN